MELTVLTKQQKRILYIGLGFAMILLANTLYLLAAGYIAEVGRDPDILPVTYQAMLITHITLGIVFCLVIIGFVSMHLGKVYRYKNKGKLKTSGATLFLCVVFLLVSGFFIFTEANSKSNNWLFIGHQITAALALGMYLVHRILSRDPPRKQNYHKGVWAVASLLTVAWIVHWLEQDSASLLTRAQATTASVNDGPSGGTHTSVDNFLGQFKSPFLPFLPVGDPDTNSPFAPSKTTTTTGSFLPARIITHNDLPDLDAFVSETKEYGFAPNYYLGAQSCERCHKDIVEQWSTSAHRFSSFNNPFYVKSVELTRQKVGKKGSQFCGGCHDPAVMLAGNMTKPIDPFIPESQAGITCLGCHAIDKIHDKTGNGNYNIHDRTESPYVFDQDKDGFGQVIHDYVLKAKPVNHKNRLLKPMFRQSEFCLTCHKVNLDKNINGYRWLRGQNEYDAWHNSGVAHNQPKTWYEPPTVRECQHCHMPYEKVKHGDVSAKDGKVRSHRFPGINTALPYIRGDYDTLKAIETFLQDKKLRVDITAVSTDHEKKYYLTSGAQLAVSAGQQIQFDVVVRNLNVGHTFPGGTNDSNEGWIDFTARVGERIIFQSGEMQADKHVDPSSHFYQAVLVDKEGNRITQRNATDIYTSVYANVIMPSTSDIARYRFTIPEDLDGKKLKVSAKLNWRKFNRTFTEFSYEGKKVPDLPVTTIAKDSITLTVSSSASDFQREKSPVDNWILVNDYGIGSFLDDDIKSAVQAFTQVTQLQPNRIDGWLNLARSYLKEGNLKKADHMLRKASGLEPNHRRIAFFWGRLLEKSGRFSEAIKAYQRTLQSYPQSRDTLKRLGRTYWLNGEVQRSIDAYLSVLEIDPENAQAFHQLQLAYKELAARETNDEQRALHMKAAKEYEKGFNKYKIDEDAAKVTARYRLTHPHENRMSQKIVVHGDQS